MTISQQLKEIYASAPTAQYVETLEFSHSRFGQTFYLTNSLDRWTFLLENGTPVEFLQAPFTLQLPAQDRSGHQDLTIVMSNVGRDMMDPLEAAILNTREPIRCIYRVYLNQPGSYPQTNPPLRLSITDVQVDRDTLSAVATRSDVLNKGFPSVLYRYTNFPGLKR